MIYPSITELSDEGVNRYTLSIATAKCARRITDEHLANGQESNDAREDKFAGFGSAKKAPANEKPVKEAINRLYTRDFKIIPNQDK